MVKLFFQELNLMSLCTGTWNLKIFQQSSQQSSFDMLIHSFCYLLSVLKHYLTETAVFLLYSPKDKVLPEEDVKKWAVLFFPEQLRQEIRRHCMLLSWHFSTPLILQTWYEGAQRPSVAFGAVGCCPQPFRGVQEGEGENMPSDNRSTLLPCNLWSSCLENMSRA